MRGGARVRSGPAPDPNALRRDRDEGEWTVLPASGRPDPAPSWPLPTSSDRELELWTDLWSRPQAIVWERQMQVLEVALYVRRLAEAEVPGSSVSLSTLVRQMADSLGLTTPGIRSNKWRIERTNEQPAEGEAAAVRSSVRDRLTVVPGGGS